MWKNVHDNGDTELKENSLPADKGYFLKINKELFWN